MCDCLLTRRTQTIRCRTQACRFFCTYWWNDVSQQIFDDEILPYFEALGDFQPSLIVDIGAASGHFGIMAAKTFDCRAVYAFEPAKRQRILLTRNVRLNAVDRLVIEPFGLWNRSDVLPFRTVGAESSFAPVSRFQGVLAFPEMLPVKTLDQWVEDKQIAGIDLIKIDAEGAELEILEGARGSLKRFRPRLLVQAYHIRDGARTFEQCARTLEAIGYAVHEVHPGKGLLYAQPAPSADLAGPSDSPATGEPGRGRNS
jgi:FkbM family methyltransferase